MFYFESFRYVEGVMYIVILGGEDLHGYIHAISSPLITSLIGHSLWIAMSV